MDTFAKSDGAYRARIFHDILSAHLALEGRHAYCPPSMLDWLMAHPNQTAFIAPYSAAYAGGPASGNWVHECGSYLGADGSVVKVVMHRGKGTWELKDSGSDEVVLTRAIWR